MIDTILSIVNKFIPDADQANKIAIELEKEYTKQLEFKSDIIKAEQQNGSGKWRPRLMYLCMAMVATHFILYDLFYFFIVVFDLDLILPAPPENEHLWSFLKIGVGGYIGSRGVERSIAWFKEKK